MLLLAAAFMAAVPAWAADFGQAARETAADLARAKSELAQTRQDIAAQRRELKNRLKRLQDELAAEKKALAEARAGLAEASRAKAELSRRLAETSGDLKELAGHVRAGARELLAVAERSPATAQDPGRLEVLRAYLNKSRFPGLSDINQLVEMFFAQMTASGQIARWRGPLVDRAGREVSADIVRLGSFTTLYRAGGEIGFATLGPASGRLLAVGGEPSWGLGRDIAAYLDRSTQAAPMDISGGAALRQLSRRESAWERLLAGGPLVWPILAVALAALILIVERLVFLRRVRANTDEMMVRVAEQVAAGDFAAALAEAEKQPGRPTSNVIIAGLALRDQPSEVIDNGLSEAMLRELPRLERFLTALKVLAAVAPLLGLLGTVTGMIKTFQVITVFGAGDPRLMAGGISEALITTQLGLAVAIPILIAAALLGRRVARLAGDMEEKAVALAAALIKAEG
jgi:biopolymer transport protein ExbB